MKIRTKKICKICERELKGDVSQDFEGIVLCKKCWKMINFKELEIEYE